MTRSTRTPRPIAKLNMLEGVSMGFLGASSP
jgi:hypothetical protein